MWMQLCLLVLQDTLELYNDGTFSIKYLVKVVSVIVISRNVFNVFVNF